MVTPYFWPCVGGVESHVLYVSKELVKRGYDVHVLTSDSLRRQGRSRKHYETLDGIHIHRFRTWLDISYYRRLWVTPSFVKLLGEMDLVHAHSYGHPHTDIAGILSRVNKRPFVLTSHGPHLVGREFRPWHHRFLLYLHDEVVGKTTLKLADAVIAISPVEVPYLVDLGLEEGKIKIIPNGIPKESFDVADGNAFRREYGLGDQFIVLFVGRLHRHKGAHVLLQAIPRVMKKVKEDVRFVFVGPDEGQKRELDEVVKQLNLENLVLFTGYLSEEDKRKALYACDLFVIPSLWEAFGIIACEAMAAGKPIVASTAGNLPYLIKDGYSGFVVEYGDSIGLGDAIIEMIKDSKLRRTMGKRNRTLARNYVWDRIVDRIEEVYRSL